MPLISIVIPIRNRKKEIKRIVKELEAQNSLDFEVVFVDDGSRDGTYEALKALETPLQVRCIHISHSGPSVARNRGAEVAEGEYLTFLDSDDRFVKDYVGKLSSVIAGNRAQLVHAGVTTYYPDGRAPKVEMPVSTPLTDPVLRPFLSGTYAVDAELFWSVGGFTEKLWFAEHRELALKLSRSKALRKDKIFALNECLYSYNYRDAFDRNHHRAQAMAARHILKSFRPELERASQVGAYQRIAVTAFAQAGDASRCLSSAMALLRSLPCEVETYKALAKAPLHFLFRPSLRQKADTIAWFLRRPSLYPELLRLLIRKFRPQAIPEIDPHENEKFCQANAVQTNEALKQLLGVPYSGSDLYSDHPDVIEEAERRVATCPSKMGGGANIDLLFKLCEALQATSVVETGVAYGWSSLAILMSIRQREGSSLTSTDLPYPKKGASDLVGCVVPNYLRDRWTLLRLPDRDGIPKAVRSKLFDLVHYDSDKSYLGRRWGYSKLWECLRPGGVFVSDDVGGNPAFLEFSRLVGIRPIIVEFEGKFAGLLLKPKPPVAMDGQSVQKACPAK